MLRDVWVGICSLYYQIIENPRLSGSKTVGLYIILVQDTVMRTALQKMFQ